MNPKPKLRRPATLALGALLSLSLLAGIVVAVGGLDGEPPPPSFQDVDDVSDATAVSQRSGSMGGPEESDAGDGAGVVRTGSDALAEDQALWLTVIEAATGAPVPDATVYYADGRRMGSMTRGRRPDGGGGWLASLERGGESTRTNAEGRAAIPRARDRLFIAAQSEGLFGGRVLQGGLTEATLELVVDETMFVRVLDGRGQPRPGVDVALSVDRISRLDVRKVVPSDDDGIAKIEHLQFYRTSLPQIDPALLTSMQEQRRQFAVLEQRIDAARQIGQPVDVSLSEQLNATRRAVRDVGEKVRQQQRAQSRQRGAAPAVAAPRAFADFVVSARMPQRDPRPVRLPALGDPERSVDLQIGGLGAVEVRVVGPDGEPLWTPCTVELRRGEANRLPMTVDPALVDGLDRVMRTRIEKLRGEGAVLFDPVGAELMLDVAVRFRDNDFEFDAKGFQGPLDGETKVIDVAVPEWFSVVTGRLVNAKSEPWRALETELLVAGSRGRIEGERVTTDDGGRFELPIRWGEPAEPYSLEVRGQLDDQMVGALVAIPRRGGAQSIELGDIVVAALPVVAEGTVRDDLSEPVANARVQLQEFLAAVGEGGRWRDVAFATTTSDAVGGYRLAGERRSGRFRARFTARGHARLDSPELSFGQVFDPTLQRIGSMTVTGNLPQWLPRGAVEVVLMQDGRRLRDEDVRVRGGGAFRVGFGGLMPGRYEIGCVLKGIGPVAERLGIVVEPAAEARVDGIDLSNAVFRYVVRAVDQEGKPVPDPGSPLLAQVVGPQGGLEWVAFPWRGDRVEFYSSSRFADVVALGAGRVPVRQQLAPGDSVLSFNQLQPIEVELPGLRSMVGERTVRISLVYDGDTGLPMGDLQAVVQGQNRGRGRGYPRAALGKSSGGWLRENDLVRMPLMFNGLYRVVARINEGRRRVSKDIGTVDAVVDGTQPQRVVLQPPAGVIQQILLELQTGR